MWSKTSLEEGPILQKLRENAHSIFHRPRAFYTAHLVLLRIWRVLCYAYAKFEMWLLIYAAHQTRGATRMARGGIRLVHGLTKNTLITYYSGMKKDPKYAFLHAFFLICLSCSFQNLSRYDQKHTLFSNFARFCTPKRCTRVQYLVLKNNPNYVNFWTSLIPPLTFEWPPPDIKTQKLQKFKHHYFIFKVSTPPRINS